MDGGGASADRGKHGYAAPLHTRLLLQYRSGGTWKTKATVLTEDRHDTGVDAYVDVFTKTPAARTWRWYYPGSRTRQPTTSPALRR